MTPSLKWAWAVFWAKIRRKFRKRPPVKTVENLYLKPEDAARRIC